MSSKNSKKNPPEACHIHKQSNAFEDSAIGRSFAVLNLELNRRKPRNGQVCKTIESLRSDLLKHDHRWNDILDEAIALFASTSTRQTLALGSPPERQKFLSQLEGRLRRITTVHPEDPLFTETL